MFAKKSGSPAHDSGMRPGESAPAYEGTQGEAAAVPPQEGEGAKMEDFVNGPDANGEHHLNISKLHAHLHGKHHGK